MKRREFIGLAGSAAAAWPFSARAQRPRKVPHVGFLSTVSAGDGGARAAVDALRELGYVDGQSVRLDFRIGEITSKRLPQLATELVDARVDVIVAVATAGTRAAQQATQTIPIVGIAMGDPVRDGLVAHYASPEGNVTGNTFLGPELVPKRLAYLTELLPSISRVGVLLHPEAYGHETMADMLAEVTQAATKLDVALQVVTVEDSADFSDALAKIADGGGEAVFQLPSPMFFTERKRLVDGVARHGLPAMFNGREFVEAGGLIAYGVSIAELGRRAATYVDKILRGAKPSELPVERPTTFELVINAGTAKALRIDVPPNLLARADEVIE